MPTNNYSDNPFDTITPYNQDPAANRGFAAGAMNKLDSVTVPATQRAEARLRAAGFTPGNQPWSVQTGWQGRLLEGARGAQGLAANPYSENYANQARAAQMALLAQMQAQQAGPSLAGLQGQRAMAQGGQAALAQAAIVERCFSQHNRAAGWLETSGRRAWVRSCARRRVRADWLAVFAEAISDQPSNQHSPSLSRRKPRTRCTDSMLDLVHRRRWVT